MTAGAREVVVVASATAFCRPVATIKVKQVPPKVCNHKGAVTRI
jgi:hypothetical protein